MDDLLSYMKLLIMEFIFQRQLRNLLIFVSVRV